MNKKVSVNVKITESQRDWLAQKARIIRDNNIDPIPPCERVYPQHLLGIAIDLLMSADIDWEQAKNIEDLKKQLRL